MTSKQRAYLRSLASGYDTVFQIGKGGISDAMTKSISDALEANELVKLRVLDNSEYGPREAAQEIAEKLSAEVVCVIGSRFVLYRDSGRRKTVSLALKLK